MKLIRILQFGAIVAAVAVGTSGAQDLQKLKRPQRLEKLQKLPPPVPALFWTPGRIVGFLSANRARIMRADDGILLQGAAAETDTYTVPVETDLAEVHAVRIEALTHSSLANNGPGRAQNGNFVISEVSAAVGPKGGPTPVSVRFSRADADFEQTGYPAAHAIDGNKATGWAIHGTVDWNVNRALTLTLASPVKQAGGGRWTLSIDQQFGSAHTLGRFRILFGTPVQSPPKPQQPNTPQATPPLWGYADLHTHPASHLAFGADSNGNGGIFWGKPGLGLDTASAALAGEMAPCAVDSHTGFDADVVRKETRRQVVGTIDSLTGCNHAPGGYPAFDTWPHSQSLHHQQMYITAVKRAYDGGLRLMVASVTDNQMLAMLWTKINYNPGRLNVPGPDPNFDLESAKRQIAFIERQAAANSSWMMVVKSAAEARQAVSQNKLAIVLGLEMDTLTLDQSLELIRNHGVRQVTPIHLVNNWFGNAAVYNEPFNAANRWMTGRYFEVEGDPRLSFRLGRPLELRVAPLEGATFFAAGAVVPKPVADGVYQNLGYQAITGGHKNKNGLLYPLPGIPGERFQQLMKTGILMDVAHMSEKSTEATLAYAERYGYPLMNSHTGLRNAEEKGRSERDMLRSHAVRMARLGGIVGHGTDIQIPDVEIMNINPSTKPFLRIKGVGESAPLPLIHPQPGQDVHSLRVTFVTGKSGLREGTNVTIKLITDRGGFQFRNLSRGIRWPVNATRTFTFQLPGGLKGLNLQSMAIVGEDWDIDAVRVGAIQPSALDTVGRLFEELNHTIHVMDRPIAFGTDVNGFAAQIPSSSESVTYPLTAASRYGVRPAGYTPPDLNRYTLGSRTFDFRNDGLAHFGMLPDLVQALSQKPNSSAVLQALFLSADAVVKMWEQSEAAARKL